MLEYIQLVTILGASLIEFERLRTPLNDIPVLLKGYPALFRLFLALCTVSLLVCALVWALQSDMIWVAGLGLLLMGGTASVLKLSVPKIYNTVWFIRLDASVSLGLLGLAMYLKVKELF